MPRTSWPIIVGGCHRSGTSLIRRLLNAHSRIYCGPEIKFFRDFYSDYFFDPIRHLRFVTSARAVLPEDELLDILGQAFIRLQERAARNDAKARWADKNPENVLYLDQWQRLLGDRWLMVHVVRNPLDTLASIEEVGFPLTIPGELDDRIDFYRRYVEAGLAFGDRYPERYYRLVYEEFVTAKNEGLSKLMDWLGEVTEPGQHAFNRFSHQSGIEDPKIAATAEVHRDSIGKWRQVLTPSDARSIWDATQDVWRNIDPKLASVVLLP